MKKYLLSLVLLAFLCVPARANVPCSLPFTLTNNTTADATQVMANYNSIITCLSGSAAASGANNDITSLGALTTPITPAQGGAAAICGAGGFTIANNSGSPSTQLTIAYSQAIVTNPSGTVQFSGPQTLTLNFGTNGVNGLDTGSIAATTFYYIYLIGQGAGTTMASLASLSSSAPTLPAGYTYSCRVASWETGSISQLLTAFVAGRRWQAAQRLAGSGSNIASGNLFVNGTVISSCGTPTLTLTTFGGISPTAVRAFGWAYANPNSNGVVVSSYAANAGVATTSSNAAALWGFNTQAVNVFYSIPFDLMLPQAQKLYVCNDSTSNAIAVMGWEDNVNAN